MILHVLRAFFVLLLAAVGWFFVRADPEELGPLTGRNWLAVAVALCVGVFVLSVDILSSRKKLVIFSGTFLGLLVGLAIAYALSFVVVLLVDQYGTGLTQAGRQALAEFINLIVGIVCSYLAISFILQTKDDFRFIIPYVEFRRDTRGSRPILIDTSTLIDGRVAGLAETGIFDARLIVPRFVLGELQAVADSPDRLKRNRGRRGLDVVARLQRAERSEMIVYDPPGRDADVQVPVDDQLMRLASDLDGRVLTGDYNLAKVAQLAGVDVINLNDLANAIKPDVLPGEQMVVRVVKPGEEPGQGVGYLDDGTMVVIEGGGGHVGQDIAFVITNLRQTSAGKMIFGRMGSTDSADDSAIGIADPTTGSGGGGGRHGRRSRGATHAGGR